MVKVVKLQLRVELQFWTGKGSQESDNRVLQTRLIYNRWLIEEVFTFQLCCFTYNILHHCVQKPAVYVLNLSDCDRLS